MKIFQTRYFPIYIINLFGVLFVRKSALSKRIWSYFPEYVGKKLSQEDLAYIIGDVTLNEERIHTLQMKWLLFIPFYILYLVFFIVYAIKERSLKKGYELNPFEREAKSNSWNIFYNKKYNWINYL